MSTKEISTDDFMKIIIAGGIGIFTLSFYMIQICCKFKFKNSKHYYYKKENVQTIKKEEKKDIQKVESKIEEIKNENNDIINIEEKKEEKKIVKKRNKNKNKDNTNIKKEEKNLDFVINDNRDGEWETVGEKKYDKKVKDLKEEDKEKMEKYYNDYLNKF